ncbi:amidohydrolase family protein [Aquincola sp. J276]|uniref:amidohydrolase family protein n=1 Tax=Aquincola sp. J276 TaxID=2898432 RepID=UPI002151A577|nr:amidohydrolase family protein [Aquincola sp. J276]MCR5868017.1 amidohydrolase family protein [Aquincola sp. J276]
MTGWDCHAHLFGPYGRYPLAADRSYTPPEAVQEGYAALLKRLGLGRGVLVHPSAYGNDFSLLLDTLAERPAWRGVIVTRPGELPTLAGLHARGVRAARFSQRSGAGGNFAGSASFDDLLALAPALADVGLHAELWTDCAALPALADRLRALPLPVVIDHMGGFDLAAGVSQPGFQTLLALLAEGHVHVKLCVYRNLPGLALTAEAGEAALPFLAAMLQANPDALVWGSDWPHLRVQPVPDAAQLLAWMKAGAGDDAMVRRILQDNPQRLYE